MESLSDKKDTFGGKYFLTCQKKMLGTGAIL
jgi:hypothetical protein